MFACIDAVKEGITDSRSTVYNIQWRLKIMQILLLAGKMNRIFIGHPSGIDSIHIDTGFGQITGCSVSHHVEGCLGHVRVRVPVGLLETVKFAFHRRDIDDVLFPGIFPLHHGGEPVG